MAARVLRSQRRERGTETRRRVRREWTKEDARIGEAEEEAQKIHTEEVSQWSQRRMESQSQ